MSKMNEISQTIEELRNAAAAINDAANWLTQQFSGTADEQPSENVATSEEKPSLTLEQVRAILANKSRAGHTATIRELLQKYGVDKLSQIDPSNYKALLRDAEELSDAT